MPRFVTFTVEVERYLKGSGPPVVDVHSYVGSDCVINVRGAPKYLVASPSRESNGLLFAGTPGYGMVRESRSDPDIVLAISELEKILGVNPPATGNAGLVVAQQHDAAALAALLAVLTITRWLTVRKLG